MNKHGFGQLYFGIRDNGEAKGQIITDTTIKTVADSIMRDIEPKVIPSIEKIELNGKDILKVSFSGSQKPYSAFGRFLVRVGTQNRMMTRDELRKLIKQEDYSYPWEREVTDFTFDDLDDNAMRNYYSEAEESGRLDLASYSPKALLASLGLLKNGKLLNAAMALFGKNQGIELKLACYATDEKLTFTDLNLLRGNIYTLMNEGSAYILNHINWRVEIDTKRREIPEIPVKAIREVVANAFAHAIYEPLPQIEINVHPGKITIYNPGSFPDELTPNDFVNKDIASIQRNPLIMEALYRCKDVEKSGTGFKRVNAQCVERGIRWESRETAQGFYFTFFRVPNDTLNDTLYKELKPREKDLMLLIKNNPKITRESLAESLGLSISTVQRITNSLCRQKYLARIGNNRFGYWEVLK